MKNPTKNKQLLSIFIDFAIMVLILFFVFSVISGIRFLLFEERYESKSYTVISESMPKEFKGELCKYDQLFDPISKRSVGRIEELKTEENGEEVRFTITFTSSFVPKSNTLRTKNLWFEYSLVA